MKLVIFGLTISSSWGNGHATLWRGLLRELARSGCRIVFFERDVPYYARHRDLREMPGVKLVLYADWMSALSAAEAELSDADVGLVSSYCPDGIAATDLLLDSPAQLRVFYDLDSPVTLGELRRGQQLSYIGPRGLADFDLVLSYTGGGPSMRCSLNWGRGASRRCTGASIRKSTTRSQRSTVFVPTCRISAPSPRTDRPSSNSCLSSQLGSSPSGGS